MRETLVKTEEFKDSPVGRIPKDWEVIPLSSIGEIVTGATPPSRVMGVWGDVLPFITPGDISEDGQVMKAERNLSASGVKYVRPIPGKTVLVVCIGSTLGKTAFATEECATNQQINAVIPNSIHEPSFIYAVLTYHIDQLLRWAGLQAVPIVNKNQFGKMLVPIAPPDEQRRISEIFDSLDKAIAHTSSLIAKLKQMKAGLLHDLLTRGLDENGELRNAIAHPEQFKDSPLGQIPKDWEVTTLGTVVARSGGFLQTGPFGSQLHAYEYVNTGVPVIMPQDIQDGQIIDFQIAHISPAKAGTLARHRVELNDVVFARRGDLERCAFIGKRELGWLCGTGCLLVRVPGKEIDGRWLAATYRHDRSQRQILARAVGSTMVNLNSTLLSDLLIAKPTYLEQTAIVRVVDTYDTRIRTEEAYRDKLKLQKKGLMYDLLTGKVRVKDVINPPLLADKA